MGDLLKKILGWMFIIFVVGGLVMQVKDNPKDTGKAAANAVNETGKAGKGMWSGIITFFNELDF